MKVKELLASLQNVDGELEIFSGDGAEYVCSVTSKDVNVRELDNGKKILTIEGQGAPVCLVVIKPKENKQLPLSVLGPMFRAYLHSLSTYSYLYQDNFEKCLGEASLGDEGELSPATWAAMMESVADTFEFKRLEPIGGVERWDFKRKGVLSTGP